MAALHVHHPGDNDPGVHTQAQHESPAHPSRRSLFRAASGPVDEQVADGFQGTAAPTHLATHQASHARSLDQGQQQQVSDLQRRAAVSGRADDEDGSQRHSSNDAGGSSSRQRRSSEGATDARRAVQTVQSPGSRSSLAVAGHDQLITWRIAAVAELADVEELLYEYGTRFRSFHIAALLAKLPVIDTSGGNSGVRVREIVRMLTAGLLTDLVPVTGPELVSCLTAFAHLRYCPPEAAPAFARELLQLFRAKLNSCHGPQLADLAWSLAKLKVMYGDVHAAVKRPAYTVKLSPNARVVGTIAAAQSLPLWPSHPDGPTLNPDPFPAGAAPHPAAAPREGGVAGSDRRPAPSPGGAASEGAMQRVSGSHPHSQGAPNQPARRDRVAGKGSVPQPQHADTLTCYITLSSSSALHPVCKVLMVPTPMEDIWKWMGQVAAKKAGEMDGDQLAKTAWAFTKSSHTDPELFNRLADCAVLLRADLTPGAITNLVWAYSSAGHRSPRMYAALAGTAASMKSAFDIPSISTVLWGFAAFGYHDAPLCTAVAKVACRRIKHYDGAALAQTFWAMATLKHYDPELFYRLRIGLAASDIPLPATLLDGMKADSRVAYISPIAGGCDVAVTRVSGNSDAPLLTPGQAADILWSVAHLNHREDSEHQDALLDPLCSALHSPHQGSGSGSSSGSGGSSGGALARLSRLDLVRCLWSIALLQPGGARQALVDELGCALSALPAGQFPREELLLLHQAQLLLAHSQRLRGAARERGRVDRALKQAQGEVRAEGRARRREGQRRVREQQQQELDSGEGAGGDGVGGGSAQRVQQREQALLFGSRILGMPVAGGGDTKAQGGAARRLHTDGSSHAGGVRSSDDGIRSSQSSSNRSSQSSSSSSSSNRSSQSSSSSSSNRSGHSSSSSSSHSADLESAYRTDRSHVAPPEPGREQAVCAGSGCTSSESAPSWSVGGGDTHADTELSSEPADSHPDSQGTSSRHATGSGSRDVWKRREVVVGAVGGGSAILESERRDSWAGGRGRIIVDLELEDEESSTSGSRSRSSRPVDLLPMGDAASMEDDCWLLPGPLREACAAAAAAAAASVSGTSSAAVRAPWRHEVAMVARDVVRAEVSEDAAVLRGELGVELCFSSATGRVAILTEGPGAELSRNAPHHVLGTAAAHKRLLAAAGLTVVSVQGHAWELLADETEQFMYLHNALTEAGVVLRS
ncbi:MAG: hypothetical protein WDW38_005911 [Sanguina aurantia]